MRRDLVVVGASAGGVESLRAFLGALDADLPAAVLIVLHLPPMGTSMLPSILSRVGTLPVTAAKPDESLDHGRAIAAPPDYHLVVVDGVVRLTRGPRENGHRPAVDVLFRSAARAAGRRVMGVMLSGALDDGTAGMMAIRQRGGVVLAQDPDDAAYPSMPLNVIHHVGADHVGSAAQLGAVVNRLARDGDAGVAPELSPVLNAEVDMADMTTSAFSTPERPGRPSGFSCPDCNGSLFELGESGMLRFRCRVGHAWSPLALLAAQSEELDTALWMALRSLEEKAALSRQLADRAVERGNTLSGQRYREKADEAAQSAKLLQRLLEQPLSTMPADEPPRTPNEEDHVERG